MAVVRGGLGRRQATPSNAPLLAKASMSWNGALVFDSTCIASSFWSSVIVALYRYRDVADVYDVATRCKRVEPGVRVPGFWFNELSLDSVPTQSPSPHQDPRNPAATPHPRNTASAHSERLGPKRGLSTVSRR